MEDKSLEKRKPNRKEKSALAENITVLPEGCFSLLVLSEKYGYAKDYIGWLSRTGRIEAVRYGKYGQWYGNDESLKNYISELASASEQRYSAQKSLLRQERLSYLNPPVVAELAVSVPALSSSTEEDKNKGQSIPAGIVKMELKTEVDEMILSEPKVDQTPLVSQPTELSEPFVMTTEPKPQQVVPNVPPVVPLYESSLSAEKKLAKRINAVLASSVMLAGVLIFLYLAPVQFGLANSWFNIITDKIKSPIAYLIDNFLKFADMFHIVFEQGIIKVANVISDKLTSKELCLEDVCVNRDQLKALLELNAIPISTSSPSVASEVTPELEITLSPTLSPTPTESPAASSDEASLAPEEREATPTQSPSITPDTIPAGE